MSRYTSPVYVGQFKDEGTIYVWNDGSITHLPAPTQPVHSPAPARINADSLPACAGASIGSRSPAPVVRASVVTRAGFSQVARRGFFKALAMLAVYAGFALAFYLALRVAIPDSRYFN